MKLRIPVTLRAFFFLVSLLLLSPVLYSQVDPLNQIVRQLDGYRSKTLQEKLFVHTDRSFYLAGETLWFKVYCVDGTLHRPLDVSKVIYLELIDKSQRPTLQTKVAVKAGSSHGSLILPVNLASGTYTFRAYTQWMRNFSPDYYFETSLTLVNTNRALGIKPGEEPLAYDIQFFPEGGNLVSNAESKVGFRAVDQYGKGIQFKGAVLDANNDTVVRFEPRQFGIGTFSLLPSASQEYKVVLKTVDGKVITNKKLPKIDEQGYAMRLDERTDGKLDITIHSPALAASPTPAVVCLLAHTRQVVKVAEVRVLQQGKASFLVDKEALGDGITHFTVFDGDKKPVCERLFFKRPAQKLLIGAKPDKAQYTTREKVSLELMTRDAAEKAALADLSVAVYQVNELQPADQIDIESYLWLSADLKGTVESPGYYFKNQGAEADAAMDNLMLTHGWRRFRWDEVLKKDSVALDFIPEYHGHMIRGRVVNQAGAAASGIVAYLASPSKQIRLYPSASNAKGIVQFEMQDFYGSREIILQTNTKRDSTYRLEVFNSFSDQFSARPFPAFRFPKTLAEPVLARSIGAQTQNVYFSGNKNRFSIPQIDSSAFYGPADENYFLDRYTRFPVMEEVMREYVPGVLVRKRKDNFYFLVINASKDDVFKDNPLVLLDGVPVFDINKIMAFSPLKINKLEVVDRKYLVGPVSFDGIVSYTTYQGDLGGFTLDPRALLVEYEGLQLQREFYAPRYDTDQQRSSRLPDFRNLLYWSPNAKTNEAGSTQLDFFTSDQVGKYVVVVQGITKNGQAGSQQLTFEVNKPL